MGLLDDLAELRHVGELCRLASAFDSGRREQLTEREYSELIGQTAGESFRYPRPAVTLRVASSIGLVEREGNLLRLTALGRQFRTLKKTRRASPSRPQGQLILSLLLDDEDIRLLVEKVLLSLERDASGRTIVQAEFDAEEPSFLLVCRVLQQCLVFEYSEGRLVLVKDADLVVPTSVVVPSGMSEAELMRQLDEQRKRGKAAEMFALKLERDRLTREGRPDLARYVVRISEDDVGAGYDIRSFETTGEPRYIEVKSSVGRAIRFDWSSGEKRAAQSKRLAYWIYFVPLANHLAARALPVIGIQDPISLIEGGQLIETPTGFNVCSSDRGGRSKGGGPIQSFASM